MQVSIDFGRSPLFSGQGPDPVVEQWVDGVLDSYATQGLSQVHLLMDQSFRDPTPYYETQVTVDAALHERVVHDRGVVYGPWLEGVGSRNRATRFKGYFHWRRSKQWLEQVEGPRILARHLPELERRLAG